MLALRQYSLAGSLGLLSLLACDRSHPVEPAAVEAASTGAAGPTVKTPSNTSAVAASDSRIDVSWQDNATNETGFEVHRSTSGPSSTFTLRASTGANATSYHEIGLDPLTQYCYEVRALKAYDGKTSYSEFSTPACATTLPPPVPTAPTGTDAKPANSTVVVVRWTDNSITEDGFRVERSLDAGTTWTIAGTVGPNVNSSSDAGRASEQPACYRVIAFNRGGDSPPSNSDCTTPPASPTGLAATGVDGPAIDLTWADKSAVEDGYQVLRAPDGVTFSAVAGLPANSTSYHDVGVSSTATYWYEVRARKDGGFSDVSTVASATAGSCVPTSPTEICGNGLDDDCNGLIDAADPACSGCASGFTCGFDFCPQGYVCESNGCCVPHCGDGVWNGDEGDVDCGGSCAAKCQSGQHCWANFDCTSGSCINSICQP